MTIQEMSILTVKTFVSVVQKIKQEQWEMTMPKDFQTSSDTTPTLRTAIDYHAYDDAWIPDMLAGKTMAEAGIDKFKGDILGEDRIATFTNIAGAAIEAIKKATDLTQIVHCSFGDYDTRGYLHQVMFFRGIRSYDVAKAIGTDFTMPPELVTGLYSELSPQAEEWRKIGVFGPEVKVAEDASPLEKLLGLTGRTL